MFSKLAIIVSAFAMLVAASPLPGSDGGIHNSCNAGPTHCCNSVQQTNAVDRSVLHTLLGIDIGAATSQIGVTCSPIGAASVSGNSCSQQPVCCSGNDYNGLIVVGCTPININA